MALFKLILYLQKSKGGWLQLNMLMAGVIEESWCSTLQPSLGYFVKRSNAAHQVLNGKQNTTYINGKNKVVIIRTTKRTDEDIQAIR